MEFYLVTLFSMARYKRIMLKISGEHLAGSDGFGADGGALKALAEEVRSLVKKKFEVAIVVGGGNFWRFRDHVALKLSRSVSDTVGMMATVMNARLLAEALNQMGVKAFALAAHTEGYYAYNYSPELGKKILKDKAVVICAGGTGNPYFTTDTAAALRALELECDVLFKDTKVLGVYDKDPLKYRNARFFPKISYEEILKRELQIMDLTSIVLCKENRLPVHVFQGKRGNLLKAAIGKKIGTLIS